VELQDERGWRKEGRERERERKRKKEKERERVGGARIIFNVVKCMLEHILSLFCFLIQAM
jgi:hypothetical protein